jgi:cytochrome subunit of sulfide dehydrogenase
MKHWLLLAAAIALTNLLLCQSALASKASAEALAYTCAGCHGTNGNSLGPATPSLAGMSAKYLIKTMKAFKSDDIEATIMNRIAMGYDNEDIAKMGEYFSSQQRVPVVQKSGNLSNKGKEIHDLYCDRCHEENGTRADSNAGFLSGQWTTYLKYSLEDAMDETRVMKRKMIRNLKAMHEEEGEQAVQVLLDYYAAEAQRGDTR